MHHNFRAGQKVVCINAKGADNLSRGEIYTVVEVIGVNTINSLGDLSRVAVRLAEALPNKTNHVGFDASRFRPAVERKTDISIFKAMLNISLVKETAKNGD